MTTEATSLTEILNRDVLPRGGIATYSTTGPHYVWTGTAAKRGTTRNCIVPILPPEEIALESAMAHLLAAVAADPSTARMTMTEDWSARVKQHFARVDLHFGAVVKNPAVKATAAGVRVIESPLLPTGSFYCVTTPQMLGQVVERNDYRGLVIANTLGMITVLLP